LIVANARGGSEGSKDVAQPAFTRRECEEVRRWVRDGGALLLIADHAPFGSAAAGLASEFGVQMGGGFVLDPSNSDTEASILVFSRDNGLLGDHPINTGRDDSEKVSRIVAYLGQSVSGPTNSTVLIKLSPAAYEADTHADLQAAEQEVARHREDPHALVHRARSVAGLAQGIALEFGRGRVVVMGEAGMFSAQILPAANASEPPFKFGMNAPGNDDRQFALNVLHWLSRAPKR
jgi:hypothetical protein